MAAKVGKGDHALDPALWAKLAKHISYVQGDFLDERTYETLAAKIAASGTGNAIFLPGHRAALFFSEVVRRLGAAGLLQETPEAFRRVVIEKNLSAPTCTPPKL
ncbi:hypothetical protein ACFS4T_16105 [Pseudomonas lini]